MMLSGRTTNVSATGNGSTSRATHRHTRCSSRVAACTRAKVTEETVIEAMNAASLCEKRRCRGSTATRAAAPSAARRSASK